MPRTSSGWSSHEPARHNQEAVTETTPGKTMTRHVLLIPLLLLAGAMASGQGGDTRARAADPANEIRKEKLREILRTRDLRSTRDAILRGYLYDRDTAVRLQATLA